MRADWYDKVINRINTLGTIIEIIDSRLGIRESTSKEFISAAAAAIMLFGPKRLNHLYNFEVLEPDDDNIPPYFTSDNDVFLKDISKAVKESRGFGSEDLKEEPLKDLREVLQNMDTSLSQIHSIPELILKGCIQYYDKQNVENDNPVISLAIHEYFIPYLLEKYGSAGYMIPNISVDMKEDLEESRSEAFRSLAVQIVRANEYEMSDNLSNLITFREYSDISRPRPHPDTIADLKIRQQKYKTIKFNDPNLLEDPFNISVNAFINDLKESYQNQYDSIEDMKMDVIDDIKAYRKAFYFYSAEMLKYIEERAAKRLKEFNKYYDDIDLLNLPETSGKTISGIKEIQNILLSHLDSDDDVTREEVMMDHALWCQQYYNQNLRFSPNFMLWDEEEIEIFRDMLNEDMAQLWDDEPVPEHIEKETQSFIVNQGSYSYKHISNKRNAMLYTENQSPKHQAKETFKEYKKKLLEYLDGFEIDTKNIPNKLIITIFELVPLNNLVEFFNWLSSDGDEKNKNAKLVQFHKYLHSDPSNEQQCFMEVINIFKNHYYGCAVEDELKVGYYESKIQEELVGNSESIKLIRQQLIKIAEYDDMVLSGKISLSKPSVVYINGLTGAGKNKIAQLLHNLTRKGKPFISVNCRNLTTDVTTVRNDLFGHEKGAYTGADTADEGAFGMAANGDIFLDEVQSLDGNIIRVLNEVLESGHYSDGRLGESLVNHKIDCRVLIASNEKIENLFSQDIVDRIRGQDNIEIPPLSERMEDVEPLANEFLMRNNVDHNTNIQLSDDALNVIKSQVQSQRKYSSARIVRAMVDAGFKQAFINNKDIIGAEDTIYDNVTQENNTKWMIGSILKNIHDYYKNFGDLIAHIVYQHGGEISDAKNVLSELPKFVSNVNIVNGITIELFELLKDTYDNENTIQRLLKKQDKEIFYIILDHLITSYYDILFPKDETSDIQKDLSNKFTVESTFRRLIQYGEDHIDDEEIDIQNKWEDIVQQFYPSIHMTIPHETDIINASDEEVFNWIFSHPTLKRRAKNANTHSKLIKILTRQHSELQNEDIDKEDVNADLSCCVSRIKPDIQEIILDEDIMGSLDVDISNVDNDIKEIADEI